MANVNRRADHIGPNRNVYEKNRKKILATQETCGICGRPIDKTLPATHPLGPVVDHIIPISQGGHPSDISNLRLVHNACNRSKSDKLPGDVRPVVSNRNLPHSIDWVNF